MTQFGRLLMILAAVLFVVGGLVYLAGRLDLPLGKLPGDIRIQRENVTCMFPLASSILISLLLTVVLNLVMRFLNK
jgi:hypothetical protein